MTIVANKEKPGRDHANQVAELLDGIAASVRIVEAAVGKEPSDYIAVGLSLDDPEGEPGPEEPPLAA